MSAIPEKREPIDYDELVMRIGKERVDGFATKHFGGVMMSEGVACGRLSVDMMFREEPDTGLPFSGWVVVSRQESADELELCDTLGLLLIAPEVGDYLHLPVGTSLVRSDERTFEPE